MRFSSRCRRAADLAQVDTRHAARGAAPLPGFRGTREILRPLLEWWPKVRQRPANHRQHQAAERFTHLEARAARDISAQTRAMGAAMLTETEHSMRNGWALF